MGQLDGRNGHQPARLLDQRGNDVVEGLDAGHHGLVGQAQVCQAIFLGRHRVDQETTRGAEVAVERLPLVGGTGDADRFRHVAGVVGLDRGQRLGIADRLALENRDSFSPPV